MEHSEKQNSLLRYTVWKAVTIQLQQAYQMYSNRYTGSVVLTEWVLLSWNILQELE